MRAQGSLSLVIITIWHFIGAMYPIKKKQRRRKFPFPNSMGRQVTLPTYLKLEIAKVLF